jgi:uracil-DNA glycosylase
VSGQAELFEAEAPAEQTAAGGDNRLRQPLSKAFDEVPAGWKAVTEAFRQSPQGRPLIEFVDRRAAAGIPVYPANVFRALELTPPEQVRAVILGQDPYHGPGQAQGLAFSVPAGIKLPPSLRNIFKEVAADTGRAAPADGDLARWARQGVLLLNTVLTVEDGQPQCHAKRGWEALTDALIANVSAQARPVAFMLWGAPAQRKGALIDTDRHAIFTANHPSPLAALRPPEPFLGCRHFSRVNGWLAERRPGEVPIDW